MTEKAPDMDYDIRARVVTLEHSSADKERRLSDLETWKAQREIESARHDEKWNAMEARIDTRFSGLESSVGDIKKTLSHINWLIIGGIVTAAVAFLIKGGFAP